MTGKPSGNSTWTHRRMIAKAKRDRDLAEVGVLLNQGKSQYEIADAMGKSHQWAWLRTKEVRLLWQRMTQGAYHELVADLWAKHAYLYGQAVDAWLRSMKPRQKKKTRQRKGTDGDGFDEASIEQDETPGDPRFLAEAKANLQQMAHIIGAGSENVEHNVNVSGPASLWELVQEAQKNPLRIIEADGTVRGEPPEIPVHERPKAMGPPALPGPKLLPEPTPGPMKPGGYHYHRKHRKAEEDEGDTPEGAV